MASAQLSSPRRAGAASDLKATVPSAPEPRSGRGLQGAGPQPRLAADPRHHGGWARRCNRAAPTPRPAPASLLAAPCPGRRARPLPTRGRGRAVPRAPGLNFPLAPLPSHVLHGRVVRGLEREPSRNFGQGAPCECTFWLSGRARGASRPPYQPSKESETAFPALRSPGHGSWKPMPKRDPGCGARPGASPSQGRCPQAQAARPCPSEPSGKGGSHAPKASGSLSRLHAELQARPALTSSAPGGHAQTAPAELGKRTRKRRARLTLGTSEQEARGRRGWASGRRQYPWEGAPGSRALQGGVAQPGTRKPCPAWPGHSGRVRLLQADPKDRKGLNTPSEKVQAPPAEAAKFDKQRLLGPSPGTRNKARVASTEPAPRREPRAPSCPVLRGPRTPAGPLSSASPESLAPSGAEDAERASAPGELPLRNTLGRRTRAGKDGSCVPGVPPIRKGPSLGRAPGESQDWSCAVATRPGPQPVHRQCGASRCAPAPRPRQLPRPRAARRSAAPEPSVGPGRHLRAPPPPPSPRRNPRHLPPPPALAPRPLRDACHLSQLHGVPRARSHFVLGEGLGWRNPGSFPESQSTRARLLAPRAPGTRLALRSLAWEGLEERPPGIREAPQACSPAATTLRGPGAKSSLSGRARSAAPGPGPPRPPAPPRTFAPAPARAPAGEESALRLGHPSPGPRCAKFNFAGPRPPGGLTPGREDPDGIAGSLRALT
ncbi:collagen alpha-1(I) chain-like [Muntiacus reevesi]|uniref:collagen alpha-1(I) chain-like n=1 Tax=Muntiacus reevesi TaxID=9886 RepID=UPI003306E7A0